MPTLGGWTARRGVEYAQATYPAGTMTRRIAAITVWVILTLLLYFVGMLIYVPRFTGIPTPTPDTRTVAWTKCTEFVLQRFGEDYHIWGPYSESQVIPQGSRYYRVDLQFPQRTFSCYVIQLIDGTWHLSHFQPGK